MKLSRNQLIINAVLCLSLLGVIIWALYAEYDRPWKQYQKEFKQIEYNATKNPDIKKRRGKINQLWLQDFGEADRCITCHQAADRSGFIDMPQPFKTHSGDYLKHHPVQKYGCVVCHDGQGHALTVDAAHGEAENWSKPILRGSYAQSSCGKCHFMKQDSPLDSSLPGAPAFIYGWRLFQEYNCIGCHQIPGYKKPDRIAPSLTSIGKKANKDWLVKWIKNPKGYMPETKMPRYNLKDEEVGYIASYLSSRGMARRAPTKGGITDNKLIKNGKRLVNDLGCPGCHKINGKGNNFAPDFSGIGGKVKPDWLYGFLKNPGSYDPETIIPDFMIPEEDVPEIAAYLMSLKKDEGRGSAQAEVGNDSHQDIEKGKKLVKDLGCTGCHGIKEIPFQYNAPELDGIGEKRVDELVFNDISGIERSLINWLKIKVLDPGRFATDKIVARMPNYDFNEKQSEALVTFLTSLKKDHVSSGYVKTLIDPGKAGARGKKVLEKYNCSGCHRINKEGGNIAPDLTGEAAKSRPEWLFGFLKTPHKVRPAPVLKARMPDFNLSDKEVDYVIEYLAVVSGEPYPYYAKPKKDIFPEDIWNGEKLYQEVFACSACHRVNGRGGQVGPDHTDLASRLKGQWIKQWLLNPQAVKPDVRMPRFKFRDWEIEALTDYLMSLGQYRFMRVKDTN